MRALIVIPARWASTRFPGKPLAQIAGTTLIERVWRRVTACTRVDAVLVATDDERIAEHVERFGGVAVMTDPALPSGTDRMAAALVTAGETEATQIVNVQGDEPLIDPEHIDSMITILQSDRVDIVTLSSPLQNEDDYGSRDVVKVVTDLDGNALYFSRASIPAGAPQLARRHVGVYGYQRAALARFTTLPVSPLESAESLEQLRALQNGLRIRVIDIPAAHLGVDRPEDVLKVERELARLGLS